MAELFTAVTGCFTSLATMITSILSWAVDEPIILIGLTASIASVAIGLFGHAKGAARA